MPTCSREICTCSRQKKIRPVLFFEKKYVQFYSLHQYGFTLAASIFLGGRNLAAKEYNISLAVTTDSQKNIFSRLFFDPQRKICISLAMWLSRQENGVFPWLFWLATKKNVCFPGCIAKPPRK